MLRRFLPLIFFLVLSLDLFAAPLKVVLLLPDMIEDHSSGQAFFDSLRRVQKDFGEESHLKLSVLTKSTNLEAARKKMESYAQEGADLIIAHSSFYREAVEKAAAKYPNVSFAWGHTERFADDKRSNIFTYRVAVEEAGYVNGVIAGLVVDAAQIGVVVPEAESLSDVRYYVEGLQRGLAEVAPSAFASISYVNSAVDKRFGGESAGLQILNGANILTGLASQSLGALYTANRQDVLWMGMAYEQTSVAPNVVLLSQEYRFDSALKEMLIRRRKGQLGGQHFLLSYANEGIRLVYNPALQVDPATISFAEKVINGLKEGFISALN